MSESAFYTNPFFWALLSMTGMMGATSLFSIYKLQRSITFVTAVLILVAAGRIVLVLPFCEQPRFETGWWAWIIGGAIILLSFAVFTGPVLFIRWWEAPKEGMTLRTTGVYGVVRHPIYLGEMLWPVGWSIIFGSIYGLALTSVWWLAFLLHALSEEAELERTLGSEYQDYMKKVRGRIFPGLPI
jgi:protein-S-isoprenylcysteine O-methyltransferase Ste14